MHIIALRTLHEFWTTHPAAETPLRGWYAEASRADWRTPADIKSAQGAASFLVNNRVVFNIKGNDYRLVVAVRYNPGILFIRFIGTHAEYDRIDATIIWALAMELKPIRTEVDYCNALAEIERLWDAPESSPEVDRLEILSILVETYEKARFPIEAPDPVAFIEILPVAQYVQCIADRRFRHVPATPVVSESRRLSGH